MKLTQIQKNGKPALGVVTETGIWDVKECGRKLGLELPGTMAEMIGGGEAAFSKVKEAVSQFDCRLEGAFAPVVTECEKVLCIGLNYRQHAIESKMEIPEKPVLFNKFANSLAGHEEEICLLPEYKEYDYEAELVVVMGREAKNVPAEEALSYVFGYTCGNDLSTRDLQFARGGQWVLSKSFDGFAPIGPCVVTADELDPGHLHISSRVNGELRQDSDTSDLIFPVSTLIADLSAHLTLKPGDLIFTGTPSGVILGYPPEKKVWLKKGDVVEIEIEGIGTLRNRLV